MTENFQLLPTAGTEGETAPARRKDSAMKVLVVEDEFLIGTIIEDAIEEAGLVCAGIAASVEDAVRLAEDTRPAFYTLDLRLANGGSGWQVAEELERGLGIKPLVLSAYIENDGSAPKHAVHGTMAKPFDLDALSSTLRAIAEKLSSSH